MVQFTEIRNRNFSVICGDPGGTFVIKKFLDKKTFPKKALLSKVSKKFLEKNTLNLRKKTLKNFSLHQKFYNKHELEVKT